MPVLHALEEYLARKIHFIQEIQTHENSNDEFTKQQNTLENKTTQHFWYQNDRPDNLLHVNLPMHGYQTKWNATLPHGSRYIIHTLSELGWLIFSLHK